MDGQKGTEGERPVKRKGNIVWVVTFESTGVMYELQKLVGTRLVIAEKSVGGEWGKLAKDDQEFLVDAAAELIDNGKEALGQGGKM